MYESCISGGQLDRNSGGDERALVRPEDNVDGTAEVSTGIIGQGVGRHRGEIVEQLDADAQRRRQRRDRRSGAHKSKRLPSSA